MSLWLPAPEDATPYFKIYGPRASEIVVRQLFSWGKARLLTVGAFLLTVKFLCLQSLKAIIRRTFPL